jgi:hypothetical protein
MGLASESCRDVAALNADALRDDPYAHQKIEHLATDAISECSL